MATTLFRNALNNHKTNSVHKYINRKAALTDLFYKNKGNHLDRSFILADLSSVRKQCAIWRACLPNVVPYYAVKCNPDPLLIQQLASHRVRFDCASKHEIQLCLDEQVDPQHILFANPIKNVQDLQFARQNGIDKMTFDNLDELDKIKQFHPRAQLIVRLLVDDSGSLMKFGRKFGASMNDIPRLLHRCDQLNLQLVGTSFHIGSGCFRPETYIDALRLSSTVYQMYKHKPLSIVDIGGGFGASNLPTFAQHIQTGLAQYFQNYKSMHICAEPGRFFSSKYMTLFTMINGKRIDTSQEQDTSARPRRLYYLNDGVYGTLNNIIFDHAKPKPIPAHHLVDPTIRPTVQSDKHGLLTVQKARSYSQAESETFPTTLFGSTCDSFDTLGSDYHLPDMSVGDWLAFENMGSYTTAAASRFNGIPTADVIPFDLVT